MRWRSTGGTALSGISRLQFLFKTPNFFQQKNMPQVPENLANFIAGFEQKSIKLLRTFSQVTGMFSGSILPQYQSPDSNQYRSTSIR